MKRDKQVLEFIQKELNMGKVIVQGKTTSRFIIQDKLGLYLIALIFNGNIRTPDKLNSFNEFLNILNKNTKKISRRIHKFGMNNEIFKEIKPHNEVRNFSLSDSWLAGFVDAEGCFYASFSKIGNRFKIGFDIAQKGEANKNKILDKLVLLFEGGKVYKHYYPNNWNYRIEGLVKTESLVSYFDNKKYSLFTKKAVSYLIWKQIRNSVINKEHLDQINKLKLISLCKTVNKYPD